MACRSPRKSALATQRYMDLLSGHYDPKDEQAISAQMLQYVQTLSFKAESLQYLKPTVELKNVVCFALALSSLGYRLPTEEGARRAGVSVKVYQSYKATAETILKISKGINVRDVGIRLGIEKAIPAAEKLLTAFKQEYAVTYEGVPDDQFVAAALSIACNKLRIKQAKKELTQISKLKGPGFAALCDQMQLKFHRDWIEKETGKSATKKRRKSEEEIIYEKAEEAGADENGVLEKKGKDQCLEEDYETFRKRIMEEAFKKVKEMDVQKYEEYKRLYADPEETRATSSEPAENTIRVPLKKRRRIL